MFVRGGGMAVSWEKIFKSASASFVSLTLLVLTTKEVIGVIGPSHDLSP